MLNTLFSLVLFAIFVYFLWNSYDWSAKKFNWKAGFSAVLALALAVSEFVNGEITKLILDLQQ